MFKGSARPRQRIRLTFLPRVSCRPGRFLSWTMNRPIDLCGPKACGQIAPSMFAAFLLACRPAFNAAVDSPPLAMWRSGGKLWRRHTSQQLPEGRSVPAGADPRMHAASLHGRDARTRDVSGRPM